MNNIHLLGFTHGDLAERNVLIHDGRPVIIDLEEMKPHICERSMRILPGAIAPTEVEFGCREMYQLVEQMEIWATSQSPVLNTREGLI